MIERYSENDFTSIVDIWERSVKATHHFLSAEDLEFYKSKVPSYFALVELYVYKEKDIIKGFLGVSDDNIEMLFNDPQFIGQGIGKELLLYAIKVLHLKNVDVNEQNSSALAFYQKFGFTVESRTETDDYGKPYPILHLVL